MIRDTLSLSDIIIGFESTLRIEHTESDVGHLRLLTRQKIESAFQIQITGSIAELQASNTVASDSINLFMAQITESLKSMALLLGVSLYDKQYSDTLKDVNYLGFARENLLSALQYLQDETLYETRTSFFKDLVRGISKIENCRLKRLLIVLVILEDLGIKEGVAIIAMYLYMGAKYNG